MKDLICALRAGALVLAGAEWAAGNSEGQDHDHAAGHSRELPETTVIANRLETAPEAVGSAYSTLEVDLLERGGIVTLDDALRLVPGTGMGSEGGQRGSISALRLRGSESDHTLVLIDGMRVTDANVTAFNLLGGESLLGLGRIDVLRGPQSALYGSEAIGGVVSMETRHGSADGRQSLAVEGGSFGSLRSAVQGQGEVHGLRWFLGGGYETTNNDRAANDFEQAQTAFRVEQDLGESTTVGLTARTWNSEFENPGDAGPFASRAVDAREAWLVTAYLEHAVSAKVRSKVVLGFYREEFAESGAFPFDSLAQKGSLDLRNVVQWSDEHQTVVGGLAEWTSFESSATGIDEEAWQTGVYANHLWEPVEAVTLTLGGRWEHFERWDDVCTWRATGSWQTPLEGVRTHASYGTGFRAPSFFELFGAIPAFGFFGDPTLKAERSRGWDAGVEWVPNEALRADLTWFHNRIDDLIDFSPANLGEATTEGIEVEAEGDLLDGRLQWRGAYTWLDATDEESGRRLVRRARHVAAFDVRGEPTGKTLLGVGGSYVSGVVDNDFSAFPAARRQLEDYLLLRVYGRYEVNEHLSLHARIENLSDRDFEEIANFPGRGLGVFGGATITW